MQDFKRFPVICSVGGINSAGRSSFDFSYKRLVIDNLDANSKKSLLKDLKSLTNSEISSEKDIFEKTLVRKVNSDLFDPDLLMKDVQAIRDLTDISFDGLDPVKQKLQSIDIKLFECVEALPQDQKEEVLALIENLPSNAGISGIDAEGNYFYKNYKITIQEDKNSPGFAKRRFAQVENDRGVVVMRGPVSFSSSTRVLVDEIKFRIDNQLP